MEPRPCARFDKHYYPFLVLFKFWSDGRIVMSEQSDAVESHARACLFFRLVFSIVFGSTLLITLHMP